jgi:hypothetical protein
MANRNMLKQAATCPAATCSNRRQHVRLQHAQTGGNMSDYNIIFMVSSMLFLLHCRQSFKFFGAVGDIAK